MTWRSKEQYAPGPTNANADASVLVGCIASINTCLRSATVASLQGRVTDTHHVFNSRFFEVPSEDVSGTGQLCRLWRERRTEGKEESGHRGEMCCRDEERGYRGARGERRVESRGKGESGG